MAELVYPELSYQVVGAAMEVHNVLGSGFLEAVYEQCLSDELNLRGISNRRQVSLPVFYKGNQVGDYRADLIVDEKIIVEIKAMSSLIPIHEAQAIHYLAATGLPLALLINFGAESPQWRRLVRNLDSRNSVRKVSG